MLLTSTKRVAYPWTWEGHQRNRQAEGVLDRDASFAGEKTLREAVAAAYVALCLQHRSVVHEYEYAPKER